MHTDTSFVLMYVSALRNKVYVQVLTQHLVKYVVTSLHASYLKPKYTAQFIVIVKTLFWEEAVSKFYIFDSKSRSDI